MKKMGRVLALSILLSMAVSVSALAASISAHLNGSAQVKTTFNSGSSGYHRVIVAGWEKHPTLANPYVWYSKTQAATGSGTMTVTHYTDAGYQFQLLYSGSRLKSTVYFGGTYIGEVIVTN